MNTEPNRPDTWTTPFSDKTGGLLQIVHVFDDGDLTVRAEWHGDSHQFERVRFKFTGYLAYRLIREELDIGELANTNSGVGSTIRYTDSAWLREIRKETPDIDKTWASLTHYIICTPEQQFEVICSDEPVIATIG